MIEKKHAWCQMCGPAKIQCSLICTVEDGVWTRVEGNPQAGNNGAFGSRALCAKGNASMQQVLSTHRLAYPLMRRDFDLEAAAAGRACASKAQGAALDTDAPDEEVFCRVTWDEALTAIAGVLRGQKERFGAKSFGILSPQGYPVLGTLGRRFLNVHGSPNYLHSGICFTQRAHSRLATLGTTGGLGQAGNPAPGQIGRTNCLVNWGCNPENSGMNTGQVSKVLDAVERGCIYIDIRPLLDPLATKADEWVPLRPGTDCALALGILHVIIGEELYDKEFVAEWCYGFDELADHVERFSPAWASRITGVPEGQIIRIARLMATHGPLGINIGNGVGDQAADGHWTVACISLISAITGNLGIPGGGGAAGAACAPLISLRPIPLGREYLQPDEEDTAHGWMPGVAQLVAPETPRWFQTPQTVESGPTSAYFRALMSVLTEDPYPLRAVFAQATNPLSATRQPKQVAKALVNLAFFVVMDMTWNASCNFADIVLPAASHYEVADQIGVRTMPEGTFVGITQPVAPPLGEARSDWRFYFDLARALGYEDAFWGGDIDAMLEWQLEGTGISLAELRQRGGIFIPRRQDAVPATDWEIAADAAPAAGRMPAVGLVADKTPVAAGVQSDAEEVAAGSVPALGEEGGLKRALAAEKAPVAVAASMTMPAVPAPDYERMFASLPFGKVQCASAFLDGKEAAIGDALLGRLPEFRGAPESPETTPEMLEDYPYVFSDVHAHRLSNHSYFHDLPLLRVYQRAPWAILNPQTARESGIADGGWMKVESPHGSVVLMARCFEGVMPGVIMGKRGFRASCDELGCPATGAFDGGCEVNVLYSDRVGDFDPFHSGMPKQTLVRITKTDPPAGFEDVQEQAATDAVAVAGPRLSFDTRRCVGCLACEVTCRQSNGIPAQDPAPCRVVDHVEGTFPQVRRWFEVSSCGKCADPACAATCPTGALRPICDNRDGAFCHITTPVD